LSRHRTGGKSTHVRLPKEKKEDDKVFLTTSTGAKKTAHEQGHDALRKSGVVKFWFGGLRAEKGEVGGGASAFEPGGTWVGNQCMLFRNEIASFKSEKKKDT